ncbi:hydroxymethylglutaryl-CoA lyase [bacterium]|nr:MAG: hydroxymethylglutaryl-CoA lyase [bacterium]
MTVRIVEVGPRDGLQNEKTPVPLEAKVAFIAALAQAGLKEIEATSFVSPKAVPQLADAAELWPLLPVGPLYSALVPNRRGLERALGLGVERIAVFTAASDAFVQKNIGMSREDSLAGFAEVIQTFRASVPHGFVRGYVSTVIACPYAGAIEPSEVRETAERLLGMGCDEVALGDTIGVGAPEDVRRLASELGDLPIDRTAWHFHDTRGTALANTTAMLEAGYRSFDASAGGLGGCPFAPGATGNLATEDLVRFLEGEGVATGVDLDALKKASLGLGRWVGG